MNMFLTSKNNFSFLHCIDILRANEIIAYPTESVFGLGCNPDNEDVILKLYNLKYRDKKKGLILIASHYNQLLPYINDKKILYYQKNIMQFNWPACITFIVPVKNSMLYNITGDSNFIAVRITKHNIIKKLCCYFNKPIISTSANISGLSSARTREDIFNYFGYRFPVLCGTLGNNLHPSRIFNIMNGEFIRNDE